MPAPGAKGVTAPLARPSRAPGSRDTDRTAPRCARERILKAGPRPGSGPGPRPVPVPVPDPASVPVPVHPAPVPVHPAPVPVPASRPRPRPVPVPGCAPPPRPNRQQPPRIEFLGITLALEALEGLARARPRRCGVFAPFREALAIDSALLTPLRWQSHLALAPPRSPRSSSRGVRSSFPGYTPRRRASPGKRHDEQRHTSRTTRDSREALRVGTGGRPRRGARSVRSAHPTGARHDARGPMRERTAHAVLSVQPRGQRLRKAVRRAARGMDLPLHGTLEPQGAVEL